MQLKSYTPKQFSAQLQKFWAQDSILEIDPIQCFLFFTGGKIIGSHTTYLSENNQDICCLFYGVIANPTHILTNGQLCDIMDEGNHCISKGSIFQEDNLLIITWSNKGHI